MPAAPLGRIAGERDGLAELLGRLDPGDDHAVGPDVERPLDQAAVSSATRTSATVSLRTVGPEVLDDLLPVEVAVLGVDHDPVEPERDGHLGDARPIRA